MRVVQLLTASLATATSYSTLERSALTLPGRGVTERPHLTMDRRSSGYSTPHFSAKWDRYGMSLHTQAGTLRRVNVH